MPHKESEPGVQELFDAITSCSPRAISFHGVVFRSSSIRYANEHDFLSGEGAAVLGGRWNRRGLKAVYASLSPATAALESFQGFESYGFTSDVMPRVFCGARVELQAVLDVSDPAICGKLGFDLDELIDEDWFVIQEEGDEAWTQAIGRGAFMAGFEALIARSARDRPDGRNLVIFPDKLRRGSRVEILGKSGLPPHPGR